MPVRKSATRKSASKSKRTTSKRTVKRTATKKRASKTPSKTFIILKSAMLNPNKALSKQGVAKVTKGTSTHLAAKIATAAVKAGRNRIRKVFMVRKARLMIFDISYKLVAGKLKICAKRSRVVNLKGKVGDAPHQACLRSVRKTTKARKPRKTATRKPRKTATRKTRKTRTTRKPRKTATRRTKTTTRRTKSRRTKK